MNFSLLAVILHLETVTILILHAGEERPTRAVLYLLMNASACQRHDSGAVDRSNS